MGRVRFRGWDWVRTTFWDSNVDPGPCLTSSMPSLCAETKSHWVWNESIWWTYSRASYFWHRWLL